MGSFFHTLKTELIYFEKYRTRREAQGSVFEYIEVFYNRVRRHSSLNYCTCIALKFFIFLLLAGYKTRTIHINACLPRRAVLCRAGTVPVLYLKLKIYGCSLTRGRSILRLTDLRT